MIKNFEDEITRFMQEKRLYEKNDKAEEIINELRLFNVIIYGAGAAGKTLLHALNMNQIKVSCFVDRRYDECDILEGIPVKSPESLISVENNTIIIVAINAGVIRSFNKEVFQNIENYCPNTPMIQTGVNLTNVLSYRYCYSKLKDNQKFNLVECLDCGAETRQCEIYQEYLKTIAIQPKEKPSFVSKKFDWFGYIMGQKCTLKCIHCCEHVPYYEHAKFSEYETIIRDCKKIADSCEFLRYIELIGGEPFLHPQFEMILKGLLEIENVGYVKIFTNATVIPKDSTCELLKNERLVVNISNYTSQAKGILLDNIYKTIEKFNSYGIPFVYSESKEWTDWGDFHIRNRTEEELKNNFANCFCADCHRVFDGILYRCPHQYAGIQRELMPFTEGEYIELNKYTTEDLASKLDDFEDLKFTDGCRRCDMPFDSPVVAAGLQIDGGKA